MIVVHNRDRLENFQNSLIERTLKQALQAFKPTQKPSRALLKLSSGKIRGSEFK